MVGLATGVSVGLLLLGSSPGHCAGNTQSTFSLPLLRVCVRCRGVSEHYCRFPVLGQDQQHGLGAEEQDLVLLVCGGVENFLVAYQESVHTVAWA